MWEIGTFTYLCVWILGGSWSGDCKWDFSYFTLFPYLNFFKNVFLCFVPEILRVEFLSLYAQGLIQKYLLYV